MNQLNSGLRNIFQDLVERRLWPVALALVVALIAIPILLSNPASEDAAGPAPAIPPVAPATGAGSALPAFEPVVTTEGSKSSEIRKNLAGFNAKDPFKVHGLSSGGGTAGAAAVTAGGDTGTTLDAGSGTGTPLGSSAGSGSGSSGDSGSQGTSGSGDSTQSGGITYFTWTATVRFGTGENPDKKRLERFRALPSSENPVVVFMGVTTDGEDAVFLVSAASGTTGDGDCEPDDTCTFLYMKPGQTRTFEAVDENDAVVTYTLKLIETNVEKTDPPKDSGSSTSSSSSRRATRAERRARRLERIRRDRRDEGFGARIEAVGF
ncbi:MAG TPA: hypothetical protein VFB51_07525 [Solirubrobacterales bacterium]|nr:hypothetical protein [Solirubrobacterales bacterium]